MSSKKPRFKKFEMHGGLPSNFLKSLTKNAARASEQQGAVVSALTRIKN